MYAGKARLDSDRVHRGELDKVKCLVKCKADVNASDSVKQCTESNKQLVWFGG